MSNGQSDDVSFTDRIDLLCDEFEREWIAGRKPRLEDFLSKLPANDREAAFSELLKVELEYRSRNGDSATDGEYRDRFPDRTVVVSEVFGKYVNMPTRIGDSRTDASLSGGPQTHDPGESSPLSSERFGDFELQEKLAQGGMGVVYRAQQISLNRTVALKMILSGRLASDEEIKRFHSEAQVAAGFDHPGIVPVYEAGTYEGRHYIAMAYVEGRSLADLLKEGPLSPREGAEKIRAVAQAVQYAHKKGVIHRDLKPANVLLDNSGQPRVTDFGLSRQLKQESALTETGRVLGTPGYMPPEQAEGRVADIGPAADVYSLGAMLYAALTGRPPFQAASLSETLRQVIDQDPVPPRQLNDDVDRNLETICLKCLQKDVHRRYTSATELADDLDRFLKGEPIHARPAGRMERAWRWTRRHPARAGLLAVGVIASLFAVGFGVSYSYQEELKKKNDGLNTVNNELEAALGTSRRSQRKAEDAEAGEVKAKRALAVLLDARRVAFAITAYENNDIVGARRQLAKVDKEHRHWEWHYAFRLCHQESDAIPIQRNSMAFAISPDGRNLAIPGDDGVRIIDRISHKVIRRLTQAGGMYDIQYSPDGSRLLTHNQRTIEVWNIRTQKQLFSLGTRIAGDKKPWMTAAAFHPDGQFVVTGDIDGNVTIRNSSDGSEIRQIRLGEMEQKGNRHVYTLECSPDGKLLACGYGSRPHSHIAIFAWETGKPMKLLNGWGPRLKFSPNGRSLLISQGRNFAIWNLFSNEPTLKLRSSGHTGGILTLVYSPDGKYVVTGGADNTVRVWKVASSSLQTVWKGHVGQVRKVACTPDGNFVISAAEDTLIQSRKLLIWRFPTSVSSGSKAIHFEQQLGYRSPPQLSSNVHKVVGQVLLRRFRRSRMVTTRGTILVDLQSNDRRTFELGPQRNVIVSPDGSRLVSVDMEQPVATVWDAVTGRPVVRLTGHSKAIDLIAFGNGGTQIASASQDGTVRVWDAKSGNQILQFKHPTPIAQLAFSDAGTLLALASSNLVKVFEVPSGRIQFKSNILHTLPLQPCVGMEFNHDATMLALAVERRGIVVFDTKSGAMRHRFSHQVMVHKRSNAIAFSPDNTRIAVATAAIYYKHENGEIVSKKTAITLLDTKTGQSLLSLNEPGYGMQVTDLRFSPDGKRLFRIDILGNVRVLNADSGKW